MPGAEKTDTRSVSARLVRWECVTRPLGRRRLRRKARTNSIFGNGFSDYVAIGYLNRECGARLRLLGAGDNSAISIAAHDGIATRYG